MESMLVFLPLSCEKLSAWAVGEALSDYLGYAVTATMMESFGFSDATDEEAEFVALNIASIAGLQTFGERLVAVALADAIDLEDEFGKVQIGEVSFAKVTSLFYGEKVIELPDSLAQAWDDPTVQELVSSQDLCWYGAAEVVALLAKALHTG